VVTVSDETLTTSVNFTWTVPNVIPPPATAGYFWQSSRRLARAHRLLRGVSSQGMSMVYGDKANPGGYLPMTPTQYVDRAIQTDATGNKWYSNAIRLVFERFPSVNPGRLYSVENQPYAMPDTIPFAAWQASHVYADGEVVSWNGSRYRVSAKVWRADRGQAWNPTPYSSRRGDRFAGQCLSVYLEHGLRHSGGQLGRVPARNRTSDPEDQGALQYVWQYLGLFGQSGSSPPFGASTQVDADRRTYIDNLLQWQYMSVDVTPAQALANFADWKTRSWIRSCTRAIDDGFVRHHHRISISGPRSIPLRRARMLDFWTRMAASQWANHPQVLFRALE